MEISGKLTIVKQREPPSEQQNANVPSSEGLPSRAIVRLQRIIEELRDVTMPDSVILDTCIEEVSRDVYGGKHLAEMNWPGDIASIYRITASTEVCEQLWNAAVSAAEQRELKARAARESKKEYKPPYKMTRLIGYQSGQTCLYVGKSDEFTSRMREHFGPICKATYAMHLSMWAPDCLHHVPVKIEYWPLASLKLSEPAIQVLEDTMWEESSPVFGKQGPK